MANIDPHSPRWTLSAHSGHFHWFGKSWAVGAASGPSESTSFAGAVKRIRTPVGDLAVWEMGSAKAEMAIVLWPSIFTDHHIYRSLAENLSAGYRVILVDGPGHGESVGPANRTFTMVECAEALKAVLDAKGIAAAVVGGTSWGGLVATEFALLHPAQTRALLLMNTAFHKHAASAGFKDRLIAWGSRKMLSTRLFTNGVARSFFAQDTMAREAAFMEHFHRHLQTSDPGALSNAVRSVLIERRSLTEHMEKITARALVIAGDQDTMYPVSVQRQATSKLIAGRLEVVSSKHISVVDNPSATERLISGFLAELSHSN